MFDALIERLKHLPGRHDQSSHGRPGRVGSAFRGAYSAARAGGATHREAWNQAKTAAEQVREQMRAEKRADLIANPKPKRVMPAKVTPPPATPTTPTTPATPASLRDRSVDEIATEFEKNLNVTPGVSSITSRVTGAASLEVTKAEVRLRFAKQAEAQLLSDAFRGKPFTEAQIQKIRDEIKDAEKEVRQRKTEYNKLVKQKQFEESQPLADGYMQFLTQMRNPTPATVNITHKGGTPEERARAESLVSATVAMFPDTGKPFDITFSHVDSRGQYTHTNRNIRSDVDPMTMVHETLHAMQYGYRGSQMNSITEDWAARRTSGEREYQLSVLTGIKKYKPDEVAYRDKVDDPYTLKVYTNESGIGQFREVLTMAFSVDDYAPIGKRRDKKLLRVGILAVLNAGNGGLYVSSTDPIYNYV